jgi:hypothetical protein
MKLEEVLPAMREGRVAVFRITRYKMIDGFLRFWSPMEGLWKKSENPANDMLDGWTLEPEPKVEWPKGSMGWAITEAGKLDCDVRRRGVPLGQFNGKVTVDEALALDWEVVP